MEKEDNGIYENDELVNKTNEYIIDCYKNNKLTNNHADDMNNFNLGQYYRIEKDYPKAIEYYEKSAEKGNCFAMCNLGYYYYYSIEKKNYPKAIEYYEMAVEKGDSKSMHNLGYHYHIEKNYPKAIEYYMMAIEYENNKAMNNLGNYYYNIEHNYPKAIEYYTMAIEKGNDMAMSNLGHYYQYIEKNYPKAIEYYTMAIEKGNTNAMVNLGYTYIIENNTAKGIEYYIMAYKHGYKNALKYLIEITTPLKIYKLFNDNNIDYPEPIDKEIQIYKNKVKNTSKLADCPVCLEKRTCIMVNCFAHYICTDCYIELHNKPCPVCRL